MRQVLFALLLTNFFTARIPAQSQSARENQRNRCELWGAIVSANRLHAEGIRIELAGEGMLRPRRTRVVNGGFDFQPVPPGIYNVRAIDHSGRVIYRRRVSLKGMDDRIFLYLPYWTSEPSLPNTVSVAELNHKIPREAQKAFRAGLKAEDEGELQKSIENFKKAIAIDPRHLEAEISLAVQNALAGQYEEAIAHAQSAFDLSRGNPDAAHVLGMSLIGARRYQQLENVARVMLANQHAVSEMHGLLAVSLIGQRRNFDEAFAHVELAAGNFPIARLLMADTLVEAGFRALAGVQISHYLNSSANECERAQLERWLASVERSQPIAASIH